MTTIDLEPLTVPLHQDETGAIRVGNTRVLLELVIEDLLLIAHCGVEQDLNGQLVYLPWPKTDSGS